METFICENAAEDHRCDDIRDFHRPCYLNTRLKRPTSSIASISCHIVISPRVFHAREKKEIKMDRRRQSQSESRGQGRRENEWKEGDRERGALIWARRTSVSHCSALLVTLSSRHVFHTHNKCVHTHICFGTLWINLIAVYGDQSALCRGVSVFGVLP